MTTFPAPNFLLDTPAAERLYHDYAADLPILDYHNHLPPDRIAANHTFAHLTEAWLAGDHYKWRAMRAAGIDERLITGDAPPREQFLAWASVVPQTARNPLYHWTHMELRRPLGITGRLLDPATAPGIWDEANTALATPACSVHGLLAQWNVRLVCTTDDPTDSLEHHRAHAASPHAATCALLPAFRPDRVFAVHDPAAWNAWVDRLAAAADRDIRGLDDLLDALARRCDAFHALGGRLADHGLEFVPDTEPAPPPHAARLIAALRGGRAPDPAEQPALVVHLLDALARLYHARGWTWQLHLGALRGVNHRLLRTLGADTGGDTIGDFPQARGLARLLGRLDQDDALPRTILYNLNPADNEVFAALANTFQDGRIPGKLQYGSGWWFLDQESGIERQLDALSNLGLLARFVGMLTDSRSFLSFSRHEYFRRILCNVLGRDITRGRLPADYPWLGGLVRDIGYHNAVRYFNFPVGGL